MTIYGLTPEERETYDRKGFIYRSLPPSFDMDAVRHGLFNELAWANFAKNNSLARLYVTRNRHFDLKAIAGLCQERAILDPSEDFLGPNLLTWRTHVFFGPASYGIDWHRDMYWGLLSDPYKQVTVHIAITPSTEDNCLCMLPGSHKMTCEEVEAAFNVRKDRDNHEQAPMYLARDDSPVQGAEKVLLKTGDFIIFHPNIVHTSKNLDMAAAELKGKPREGFLESYKTMLNKTNFLTSVASGSVTPPPWLRVAMAIRIIPPEVEVQLEAMARTKGRDRCSLLQGSNEPPVNELLPMMTR
ncbi:phytanoyl-CoA dioxygenase family protein [Prochlorothrix hollandica]|uniref:phytanoyl-CoA dioxygenase family protein n=1 Tax=Prochlorothrix hollandica TaxID=1223 RepID=UPI00333E9505